ncbi:MAG: preprotein translocase subunit YajC [Veillonella sp.]|uniref:preprotein translocase subunit YajC n=1 Tax=Veillonella sp. TaxID=1926307 RepID=UPI0025F3A466|nr:preprotein translocase subunit YajC [Veillonella sp.]MBS4913934.1 preprotein translocase subunit YajC [Veillonella sp.]
MADLGQLVQAGWPILLMIVIFYFLLYRPQKKQQKARNELLNNLKRGQKIVTIGGIYGTITELHEDYVILEVAEKVQMKFARSSVGSVVTKNDK